MADMIQEMQNKETHSQPQKDALGSLTIAMTYLDNLQHVLNEAYPTAVLSLQQHPMHMWIMEAGSDEAAISRTMHGLAMPNKHHLCTFVMNAILQPSLTHLLEYM